MGLVLRSVRPTQSTGPLLRHPSHTPPPVPPDRDKTSHGAVPRWTPSPRLHESLVRGVVRST